MTWCSVVRLAVNLGQTAPTAGFRCADRSWIRLYKGMVSIDATKQRLNARMESVIAMKQRCASKLNRKDIRHV